MLKRLRERLPQDSLLRKPLVFEVSLVLVAKLVLITVLWHITFKPIKPIITPDIHLKMGFPTPQTGLPVNPPKDT